MQGIGCGDTAADLVQEVDLGQAVAETGHGRRGGSDPAYTLRHRYGFRRVDRGGYCGNLAIALFFEQLRGILRGLVDHEAHLGAGGLEVRNDAVVRQLFGGCRTDRKHDGCLQPAQKFGCDLHPFGDLEEVNDLNCRHEEDHVDLPVDDLLDAIAERLKVQRQRPLVDGHLGQRECAEAQLGEQFGV